MTKWEDIIPSPLVYFGGAVRRIEALRELADIAENLNPRNTTHLRNVASVRLGLSRRKIEEEYIPDLETRGILVFHGSTFTVNIEPVISELPREELSFHERLEANPKAKPYLKAKAKLAESKLRDARGVLEADGSCGRCGFKDRRTEECFEADCKGLKVLLGSTFDGEDEKGDDN
jgi:hypothetical protein